MKIIIPGEKIQNKIRRELKKKYKIVYFPKSSRNYSYFLSEYGIYCGVHNKFEFMYNFPSNMHVVNYLFKDSFPIILSVVDVVLDAQVSSHPLAIISGSLEEYVSRSIIQINYRNLL